MDIERALSEKEFEKRTKFRKVIGWIMFGMGIASLVLLIIVGGVLIIGILAVSTVDAAPFFFIPSVMFTGILVILFAVGIGLTIMWIKAGKYMAKGINYHYVQRAFKIFMVLSIISLALTFIDFIAYYSPGKFGDLFSEFVSIGVLLFFMFSLKYTKDTFDIEERPRTVMFRAPPHRPPGPVGIIWPEKEFVPRDLEDKGPVYTKEYTRELEEERRRVSAAHEKTIQAGSYDFGTISGGGEI